MDVFFTELLYLRPLRDGPLLVQQYIKGDFLTHFTKK